WSTAAPSAARATGGRTSSRRSASRWTTSRRKFSATSGRSSLNERPGEPGQHRERRHYRPTDLGNTRLVGQLQGRAARAREAGLQVAERPAARRELHAVIEDLPERIERHSHRDPAAGRAVDGKRPSAVGAFRRDREPGFTLVEDERRRAGRVTEQRIGLEPPEMRDVVLHGDDGADGEAVEEWLEAR